MRSAAYLHASSHVHETLLSVRKDTGSINIQALLLQLPFVGDTLIHRNIRPFIRLQRRIDCVDRPLYRRK